MTFGGRCEESPYDTAVIFIYNVVAARRATLNTSRNAEAADISSRTPHDWLPLWHSTVDI